MLVKGKIFWYDIPKYALPKTITVLLATSPKLRHWSSIVFLFEVKNNSNLNI